jgi:hypothetical protein
LRGEDLVGGASRCAWVSGSRLVIAGSVIGCSDGRRILLLGEPIRALLRVPVRDPGLQHLHPAGHIPLVAGIGGDLTDFSTTLVARTDEGVLRIAIEHKKGKSYPPTHEST